MSNHALEPTRSEAVHCNRRGARLSASVGPTNNNDEMKNQTGQTASCAEGLEDDAWRHVEGKTF